MENKFELLRQADKESAAAEAGEYLNLKLLDSKKTPVLLLLSGGSAFEILNYIGPSALGPNLTVSVLDERFSLDEKVNNFAQLQKTDFYKDALDAEASFFGTFPRPNETIEQLAQRWEANLKR
ncbi:MAG TPA: hypothetical protein VE973_01820, partial [Candidatus Limnocylindria bacterium]|nr:hypothetical protein [Candidatus Limnocylindria bacterium]